MTWNLSDFLPDYVEKNLDEKDKVYYKKYNQLINKYSKMISDTDFNLTKDYAPVKDIIVEVRVLKDIKDAKIDGKRKNLVKNHTYTCKKCDIEHYLRRGMLVINE